MQLLPTTEELTELAIKAMRERGFLTEYPEVVITELDSIKEAAKPNSPSIRDMRDKLWFSLDNDDSKDLDQITYAEKLPNGRYKIYVAIADVDSLVKKDDPIDRYAQSNTTSVYTPTKIFSMLPEKLSTNLTSLNEGVDRLAVVSEVEIYENGTLGDHTHYQAYVKNQAKLAYNSVSDWLDGKAVIPPKLFAVPGMDQQVKLQDEIAHHLKAFRHAQGSLTLETIEAEPEFAEKRIVNMKVVLPNRGRSLIEEFMIAANTATALFLKENELPSLRRVVRTPKRWDRIVEIAKEHGENLPEDPNAKALDLFLIKERLLDPLHFPDLSLTVIKLLGNGEYIVEYPGASPVGHFSLALKNYTHSTAPNRRYPDIITQRLVKGALSKTPPSYAPHELEKLAKHCTQKEDDATKVERQMKKSASIVLLSNQIGEVFDALITGVGAKGTFVRVLHPPVDGKLVEGFENMDIGHRIKVKLVSLDLEKGYIDFAKA